MNEFLNSWWGVVLCTIVSPVVWVLVKRFAKKSENTIDDEIVAAVDEVIAAKRNAEVKDDVQRPERQSITSPEGNAAKADDK